VATFFFAVVEGRETMKVLDFFGCQFEGANLGVEQIAYVETLLDGCKQPVVNQVAVLDILLVGKHCRE